MHGVVTMDRCTRCGEEILWAGGLAEIHVSRGCPGPQTQPRRDVEARLQLLECRVARLEFPASESIVVGLELLNTPGEQQYAVSVKHNVGSHRVHWIGPACGLEEAERQRDAIAGALRQFASHLGTTVFVNGAG